MVQSLPRRARGFASKLLLALLALACLAIGLLGVLLPVIPGLLFLLFAALAAARLSPKIGSWLGRFPAARSYLGQGSRISRLNFADKCRYGFWVTLQLTVDTLRLGWQAISHLLRGRPR